GLDKLMREIARPRPDDRPRFSAQRDNFHSRRLREIARLVDADRGQMRQVAVLVPEAEGRIAVGKAREEMTAAAKQGFHGGQEIQYLGPGNMLQYVDRDD